MKEETPKTKKPRAEYREGKRAASDFLDAMRKMVRTPKVVRKKRKAA